jgi:NACalpha-BTF3-like transcription factor
MKEMTINFKADTSELDLAIEKAKVFSRELEKAKSLINEMTSSKNENSEKSHTKINIQMDISEIDVAKICDEIRATIHSLQEHK